MAFLGSLNDNLVQALLEFTIVLVWYCLVGSNNKHVFKLQHQFYHFFDRITFFIAYTAAIPQRTTYHHSLLSKLWQRIVCKPWKSSRNRRGISGLLVKCLLSTYFAFRYGLRFWWIFYHQLHLHCALASLGEKKEIITRRTAFKGKKLKGRRR